MSGNWAHLEAGKLLFPCLSLLLLPHTGPDICIDHVCSLDSLQLAGNVLAAYKVPKYILGLCLVSLQATIRWTACLPLHA